MTLFKLTRLPQNVAGRQRVFESDISWIFGNFFALFACKYELFNLTTFQKLSKHHDFRKSENRKNFVDHVDLDPLDPR